MKTNVFKIGNSHTVDVRSSLGEETGASVTPCTNGGRGGGRKVTVVNLPAPAPSQKKEIGVGRSRKE